LKYDNSLCFNQFAQPVNHISLPDKFTFPFYYLEHELTKIAASQIQQYLTAQKVWKHDFGIAKETETSLGKMFGVLVVKNQHNEVGFLAAFSGKMANQNLINGFVPPIFDRLDEDGFFIKEETVISKINDRIKLIEEHPELVKLKVEKQLATEDAQNNLDLFKKEFKAKRQTRREARRNAKGTVSDLEYEALHLKHKKESYKQQQQIKLLEAELHSINELYNNQLATFTNQLAELKKERKERSALLQKQLFEQYNFLNVKGEVKNVISLFKEKAQPPSGAGDCCAPKLLQYAFENDLKPICIGEFWWGISPKLEVRHHGVFYPACRSKCEPILAHMLLGLNVEDNPLAQAGEIQFDVKTLFEDKDIAVINKPAGMLSVPGKSIEASVYLTIKLRYPNATGPIIVHRLDMSTSGIMVIAKTKEAHKALQKQFLNKQTSKKYVALLDGVLAEEKGEIDLPIRVDLDDRPRQVVCYDYGKPAKTQWEKVKVANNKTLVNFYPVTGRTHQLRLHAAHKQGLNVPIVGDDLYGKKGNRLMLHAQELGFKHPISGKQLSFKCDCEF